MRGVELTSSDESRAAEPNPGCNPDHWDRERANGSRQRSPAYLHFLCLQERRSQNGTAPEAPHVPSLAPSKKRAKRPSSSSFISPPSSFHPSPLPHRLAAMKPVSALRRLEIPEIAVFETGA